jgi:hypothetical protein
MQPPGAYKIRHRATAPSESGNGSGSGSAGGSRLGEESVEACLGALLHGDRRCQRILESLRAEILEGGGGSNLRIRRVFQTPREIYRLELELPDLGYQRTTLLDREALEELLEADDVRKVVENSTVGW